MIHHLEMPSKILRHQHERSGKCQKRVTWLEEKIALLVGLLVGRQKEK